MKPHEQIDAHFEGGTEREAAARKASLAELVTYLKANPGVHGAEAEAKYFEFLEANRKKS